MSCGYAESTMSSSFVCHPTQTKKTQPFDVAFFRPLKIKWHKILNDQKTKHTKESSLPKTAFPRLLKELTNELTSISSNIDEVLLINPSVNVFVFGDFNIHHMDWLAYFDGTDRPGELCYDFSISNYLTQMVNFPI